MPFEQTLAAAPGLLTGLEGRAMDASEFQREPARRVMVDFILMGFDQEAGVRRYAFHRIADATRTDITVGVDLALLPVYGIRIQELPLLCRELLERRFESDDRALTLTEVEMRVHAEKRAAAQEAAERRRKPRRFPQPG